MLKDITFSLHEINMDETIKREDTLKKASMQRLAGAVNP